MKFSYIMNYSPDNSQRLFNLQYVLNWLNQNRHKETFEIIVVKQGKERTLSEDLKFDKYRFGGLAPRGGLCLPNKFCGGYCNNK